MSKRFHMYGGKDYWKINTNFFLCGESYNECGKMTIAEGEALHNKFNYPSLTVHVIDTRCVITAENPPEPDAIIYDGPWPPTAESIAELANSRQ